MNPTDLRAELAARAADADRQEHTDLLPGVRRKIRATKRRRVATAVAGTAAVAALAIGVVPSVVDRGESDPVDRPSPAPSMVTGETGIVFPARVDGRPLQAAEIGAVGQTSVSFLWTPDGAPIEIQTVCSSGSDYRIRVTVDDLEVTTDGCAPLATATSGVTVLYDDDPLWSRLNSQAPARVGLALVDDDGKPVADRAAVLAAGIYRAADRVPTSAMPSQPPPTSADDYVEDGIRYRRTVGGDTLLAATITGTGRAEAVLRFTPPTADVRVNTVCLGRSDQQVTATINGKPLMVQTCTGRVDDPGAGGILGGERGLHDVQPGRPNVIRVRLTDRDGASVPPAATTRLGVGIYRLGDRRLIADPRMAPVLLPQIREHLGHRYYFSDAWTAPVTRGTVWIRTPANVPFVVVYGTDASNTAPVRLRVEGVDGTPTTGGPGGGESEVGQPAHQAGLVRVRIVEGRPTKGKLYVALYLPTR